MSSTTPYLPLGQFIRPIDERNRDGLVTNLLGVSFNKGFIPSVANTIGTDMSKYKVVRKGQFACSLMQVGRDKLLPVALYERDDEALLSSAYVVFDINDTNKLHPEYLRLCVVRKEFDRQATFLSGHGVRANLPWEDFCSITIPVPPITEQTRIVSQFTTLEKRISLCKARISLLERTASALYRKTFVDGIDRNNLPDGWRMGTLEEVANLIVAGTIPIYDDSSNKLVLGQKCIHDHRVDLIPARRHTPKASCLYLQAGDILINSTGDGTLGRVAQYWGVDKELAFDSNMTLLRPLNDDEAYYLGQLLVSLEEYFVRISQGSTNQTRLYCSMVRATEVILPSDATVWEYAIQMRPIQKSINNKYLQLSCLERTKKLLLTQIK
mgnify:FL=1